MAHDPTPPAAVRVRKLEPQGRAEEADLSFVSRLHRRALPQTASSRAGPAAVAALYRAVVDDPDAFVLAAGAPGTEREEGGFASGTVSLRVTEARVRRSLSVRPALFVRVMLRHLLAPWHLLSQAAWSRKIPGRGVGYILTIGATEGSPVRGAEILRALERELASRGMAESWVDTEGSNERALKFYARNGYEIVARSFGQVLLRKPLGP